MTFTTAQFWLFFAVVIIGYAVSRGTLRKAVLLAAGYIFYGTWSFTFLLLLISSTLVDYVVSRQLAQEQVQRRKRIWLTISLVYNLGLLCYFKYADFFVESLKDSLNAVGVTLPWHVISVALPVGISFYTFQSIAYVVDCYRGKARPATSLLDFANYVAFFPQLVAGPIERVTSFLPQIQRVPAPNLTSFVGFGLIALGCCKKVLGDHFASVVDPIFSDLANMQPWAVWLGTYTFAGQIYLDFSGYSDIALGLAELLGFHIMDNFQAPYGAVGPSDFWRRWHISLSSWLRDYLYIPLGGGRSGNAKTVRNLMITMGLGGLWHGAAWNYVLWGVFHGAVLVLERYVLGAALLKLPLFLRRLLCFHTVCVGWALFRARSLEDCKYVITKLVTAGVSSPFKWLELVRESGDSRRVALILASTLCLVVLHSVVGLTSREFVRKLSSAPLILRVGTIGLMLYGAALLSPREAPPFIYFQF